MDTGSGVFDKNGIELAVGQRVEETIVMHGKNGDFVTERTIGVINYIRGCHVIDFGGLGVYSFYDRHPKNGKIQDIVWRVLP
jgi:hypothetical protein